MFLVLGLVGGAGATFSLMLFAYRGRRISDDVGIKFIIAGGVAGLVLAPLMVSLMETYWPIPVSHIEELGGVNTIRLTLTAGVSCMMGFASSYLLTKKHLKRRLLYSDAIPVASPRR